MSNMMSSEEMQKHFKSSIQIEKEYELKIQELEKKLGLTRAALEVAREALKSIEKMRSRECAKDRCTCVYDHAAFTLRKIKDEK